MAVDGKMLNKKTMLTLFSLVLVSGCIGGGGGAAGPSTFGVIATAFETDVVELESGDRFTLFLEVENTGGSEAKDVIAFLHGIPIGTGSDSFRKISGNNPVTLASTLTPPEEVSGLRGDIANVEWDLQAPDLPEGISLPYEPRARIMYRYKTVATSTVTALTSDEHRRLRERGEPIPTQTDTIISKGPVAVTIDARAPVVIRDDTDRVRVIVNVELLQTGSIFNPDFGGYKTDGKVPQAELDRIRVRIFAPDVSATDEECDVLNRDVLKSLRAGTSTSFSCELKPGSFVGRKDIPIRAELTYNFLTDTTTQIAVVGSRTTSPTGGTGGTTPPSGGDEGPQIPSIPT